MPEVTYAPRPRQPTGNRAVDVHNPLFQEAETRVYNWLTSRDNHIVRDCRKQHTYHDFVVDDLWTVDVKCDQLAAQTGRVAWELYVEKANGTMLDGWGRHEHLDYVAFVQPGEASAGWPVYLVDVQAVRSLLVAIEAGNSIPTAAEYRPFTKVGTDRTGIGVAISLALLARTGCIVEESHV